MSDLKRVTQPRGQGGRDAREYGLGQRRRQHVSDRPLRLLPRLGASNEKRERGAIQKSRNPNSRLARYLVYAPARSAK